VIFVAVRALNAEGSTTPNCTILCFGFFFFESKRKKIAEKYLNGHQSVGAAAKIVTLFYKINCQEKFPALTYLKVVNNFHL
jgi:hypothetical protein